MLIYTFYLLPTNEQNPYTSGSFLLFDQAFLKI